MNTLRPHKPRRCSPQIAFLENDLDVEGGEAGPGGHAPPDEECNGPELYSQWVACTENRSALQSAIGVIAKLGRV